MGLVSTWFGFFCPFCVGNNSSHALVSFDGWCVSDDDLLSCFTGTEMRSVRGFQVPYMSPDKIHQDSAKFFR